jgi:hypothetical protein
MEIDGLIWCMVYAMIGCRIDVITQHWQVQTKELLHLRADFAIRPMWYGRILIRDLHVWEYTQSSCISFEILFTQQGK